MTSPADVFVHLLPLPVHGACTQNADGSYSVFLNANDSRERQEKAYRHELDHILNDDLHGENADEIERKAHKGNLL